MIEKIKNLKTSEKVILILLLLVVLYGLYEFLSPRFAGGPGGAGSALKALGLPDIEKITSQVSEVLTEDQAAMIDAYTVARAETEWESDPFFLGKSPLAGISLTYSGYIEYAGKVLAIINNVEYQVDDELEAGGYYVREITPDKVVIEDKGKLETITVQFAGE